MENQLNDTQIKEETNSKNKIHDDYDNINKSKPPSIEYLLAKYNLEQERKIVPFNITLPWNESISSQIGIPIDQINAGIAQPRLFKMVSNTCSILRDQAIKELMKQNYFAQSTLKEICQGDGQSQINGKLTKLGACKNIDKVIEGQEKPKKQCNQISNKTQLTSIHRNRFDRTPQSQPSKQQNPIKSQLSNNLNSDGVTLNSNPTNRFKQLSGLNNNNSSDKNFDEQQNDLAGSSNNASNIINTVHNERLKSNETDESKALGDQQNIQLNEKLNNHHFTQVELPQWMCPVICAGLNLSSINEYSNYDYSEQDNGKLKMLKYFDEDRSEEHHLKHGRQHELKFVNHDPSGEFVNGSSTFNGFQECETAKPDATMCMNQGDEISKWIVQRMTSPDFICNFEDNDCGLLK